MGAQGRRTTVSERTGLVGLQAEQRVLKMKGFIVYPTYRITEGKAYIHLFGRLKNGESFLTINHFRPYFYILAKDREKALSVEKEERKNSMPELEFQDTEMTDYHKQKMVKVLLDIPRDVPEVRKAFQSEGISCYEADIRFAYRYLIDKDLRSAVDIEGKHEMRADMHVDRVYVEPKLTPVATGKDYDPKLKVLSFDIETDMKAKKLYSIALYSTGGAPYEKVLMIKDKDVKGAETVKDEKVLLERFNQEVIRQDPDVIIGWNVIDFDLKVLKEKFSEHGLGFKLGRTEWDCRLRIADSFFMDSRADVPGRSVLDGIHLIKVSFIRVTDYKLSTVAKELLGKDKIFTGEGRFKEIEKSYEENPELLAEYNLLDAKLTEEVVRESKTLDLTIRRSMLTRMQLDRVNAAVASLDSLYLKELQKKKMVAPSSGMNDREERIKGGFVRSSKPGIYSNILVLDFKSLYPSIIRTFNIDPANHVPEEWADKYDKKDLVEAPNGALFRNNKGILPDLIHRLWQQRDAAKKRDDPLSANAIKILMNSFFGVLANPSCRFYSLDVANAITHFGQRIIKMCADRIEEQGHDVIYGDTDSIFVKISGLKHDEAATKGEEIQRDMNKFFRDHIRKTYRRDSYLELEFEKVYKRFFMPRVRGKEQGAKKRYAGLIEVKGEDKLDFVGLEVVRRDWTELAKKFQTELFYKVFHDEKIEDFIHGFVSDMEKGKYDDLLVYRKAIRKKVEDYVKTTPPHIQAARKIGRNSTGLIEYVMTEDGPEAVEAIKHKIDYSHYLEKQIRPLADSVLIFYDKTFDEIVDGNTQSSLLDF